MVDIASRIAALYPEDRALLIGVLEAVEAKELIEKARDVLGVSPTDDMEQMSTGADMAEMMTDREGLHIEPISPSKSQQRRIAVQMGRPMPGIEPPQRGQKRAGRSPRHMCAAYGCCYKAHVGGDWCTTHEAEVAAGRTPRRRHEAG